MNQTLHNLIGRAPTPFVPVILAGGNGTRLWPLSRKGYPKQFLNLVSEERSLFQETVLRASKLPMALKPLIICNEDHRFMVAEQLRLINIEAEAVLLEPVAKNTAPAIAFASLWLQKKGITAPLFILPSDHIMNVDEGFAAAVSLALSAAQSGKIATFGMVPERAETGYGYIQSGALFDNHGAHNAFHVLRFVEKPDAQKATAYVESKEYFWNSGMFMVTPDIFLSVLALSAPDIFKGMQLAFDSIKIEHDFIRIDERLFSEVRAESIDYAVMEKTKESVIVPLALYWNDVGAWHSVSSALKKDEKGNVLRGDVISLENKNCFIRSESRLVAALGLDNLIVVETSDAVLIAHKDQAQQVKSVVLELEKRGRHEGLHHTRVYRPWGWYESICKSDRFQVKRIGVNPQQSLSLQMHHHRSEHWVVVRGTAEITCGEDVFLLTEDQSTYIPLGKKHRLKNTGVIQLEIIEVQTGSYLGEDDIVRFSDNYGRSFS